MSGSISSFTFASTIPHPSTQLSSSPSSTSFQTMGRGNNNPSSNNNNNNNNKLTGDPIQYVNDLTSKPSVNLDSLVIARKNVQTLADDTNTQLKRNVYKNYQLFIDTSKEISYLKSEMSQLNSFLNEEHKLLESLLSISIGGSKAGLTATEKKEALDKVKEERERKMLQMSKSNLNGPLPTKEFKSVIDNIEGGAGILENRVHCLIYFEGEVIELDDKEDYKELHGVYLILLNDSLIINTILSDRTKYGSGVNSNPMNRKFKFQSIIDLETIAAVNVKDRRYPKFELAFKILMPATTKMFLTTSTAKKKAWMEAFDIAKKYRRTSRLQRRDTMIFMSTAQNTTASSSNSNYDISSGNSASNISNNKSPSTNFSSQNINPFEELNEELEENNEADPELPVWLIDLPDDLDVFIAQRNFEEAVKLVTRAHEHFFIYPKWCDNQMQVDLKLKIDNKISELVDALSSELNIAPDRSVQTGPRASRRAVSLLLRLGKSSLAIRLFLDQRTKLLRYYFKQQKASDGATLTFMKRMTNLSFSHIVDTSKEFLRAFEIDSTDIEPNLSEPDLHDVNQTMYNRRNSDDTVADDNGQAGNSTPSSASFSHTALACLNAWNYEQLLFYLNLFPRHVFINQVNSLTAAECVGLAIHHCIKLRQAIGVDFMFVLSRELKQDINRLVGDIRDKLLEAIKLRSAEDRHQTQAFDSRSRLSKFVSELTECDIGDIDNWIDERMDEEDSSKTIYTVMLTTNTVNFTKSYINTVKDLIKLADYPTTVKSINEALVVCFKSQMKHMVTCLKRSREPELIRLNIAFLLDRVIPAAISRYCTSLKVRIFEDLHVLTIDYAYLKEPGRNYGMVASSTPSTPDKQGSSPYGSPVPTPRARKTQIQINHQPGSNNNSRNSSAINSPSRIPGATTTTTTSNGDNSDNNNYSMATYL